MLTNTIPADAIKNAVHVPATNTACVITLASNTSGRYVIHNYTWSYSDVPTGGRLTIADGATTIMDVDITAGGPGSISREIQGTYGNAVVVTLAAGGVQGKLNISYNFQGN